jgi:hypothetical protein
MKFIVFHFMLAAFAIAVPVADSSSKHFRLSVQQDEHLKINENTIATHHTVLYTVIHDTDLEMGRVLLCYDHIDVSLKNRWLEDFLLLAAQRGHLPITKALVVDGRRKVGSLKRSLYFARNHCIRRAIQSMIEDRNTRQSSLTPLPRRRIGGL